MITAGTRGGGARDRWPRMPPAQHATARRAALACGVLSDMAPFPPRDWPPELPHPASAQRLMGGWVGATWRATLADGRDVVVKSCPYPAEVEADGYAALAGAGVPVPTVLGVAGTTIVTTFVSAAESDWSGLGAAVAGMHSTTGQRFGWHRDNRAGRFVQVNAWTDDWPTFFAVHRVRTHLADPAVPDEFRRRLHRACDGPIQARLPDHPPASLTHGDLWMGNIVDGRWLIDPEVSRTDRELDLANMLSSTTHRLPAEFWRAYTEVWPLPPDFEERRLVLGLHHRLLQVRHFGPARLADLDRDLGQLGW